MQTVYVDVLIITNMFEDFLLLCSVKYILRLKTKYFRLVLGSITGGILSIISLINTGFFIGIIFRIIVAAILILIVFGFKNKRMYLKSVCTLIVITFLLSGALICFYLALKPNGMMIINNRVYFNISPLLLIILTLVVYFILLLYKKLFRNHNKSGLIKDLDVYYKDNAAKIICKVDSGLNAKEPFSGNSVIVVEKDALGFNPIETKLRIIPYKSINGNGIIYGFKADAIKIDDKTINEDIYIGIYNGKFNSEIKGLIPQNILGE